jgi:hypothetical protein
VSLRTFFFKILTIVYDEIASELSKIFPKHDKHGETQMGDMLPDSSAFEFICPFSG